MSFTPDGDGAVCTSNVATCDRPAVIDDTAIFQSKTQNGVVERVPTCIPANLPNAIAVDSANSYSAFFWHEYTPTRGGLYQFTTCTGRTFFDTALIVTTGPSACDPTSCLGKNDDAATFIGGRACLLESIVTACLNAGKKYFVGVYGYDDSTGLFGVSVTRLSGCNQCTPSCNKNQQCGSDGCTADGCGICGPEQTCKAGKCVCPDNSCNNRECGWDSCGKQCGSGKCPNNQLCVGSKCQAVKNLDNYNQPRAKEITLGKPYQVTTEVGKLPPNKVPDCDVSILPNGVWFKFKGAAGTVELNTCSNRVHLQIDTTLHVYKTVDNELQCVAASDDAKIYAGSACPLASAVTFKAKRATTYWIVVNGYSRGSTVLNTVFTPDKSSVIKTNPGSLATVSILPYEHEVVLEYAKALLPGQTRVVEATGNGQLLAFALEDQSATYGPTILGTDSVSVTNTFEKELFVKVSIFRASGKPVSARFDMEVYSYDKRTHLCDASSWDGTAFILRASGSGNARKFLTPSTANINPKILREQDVAFGTSVRKADLIGSGTLKHDVPQENSGGVWTEFTFRLADNGLDAVKGAKRDAVIRIDMGVRAAAKSRQVWKVLIRNFKSKKNEVVRAAFDGKIDSVWHLWHDEIIVSDGAIDNYVDAAGEIQIRLLWVSLKDDDSSEPLYLDFVHVEFDLLQDETDLCRWKGLFEPFEWSGSATVRDLAVLNSAEFAIGEARPNSAQLGKVVKIDEEGKTAIFSLRVPPAGDSATNPRIGWLEISFLYSSLAQAGEEFKFFVYDHKKKANKLLGKNNNNNAKFHLQEFILEDYADFISRDGRQTLQIKIKYEKRKNSNGSGLYLDLMRARVVLVE
eukprot:TRINITY_DN5194_c0_g1_i1.p1 TRINITY_DN5194_c0_g1~~TRINITY_DN5194_c0_g1_i1.p1  ORF type:complete len:858 (+),score=180.11 TRINITY_DN5194_c0_g1_i1:334-2907(+)